MDILRISILGTVGVLLGILLKSRAPEYTSLITVGIGLMILGLAAGKIGYLFQSLEKLKECLPVDGSYITTLLKMIGICRLSVMVLSMPVLLALLDTIQGFLV